MKLSKMLSTFAAIAVTTSLVGTIPLPAQAVTSCKKTQEVRRDTRSNYSGTKVTFRTITSNAKSGNARYQIRKGSPTTGKVVCSGSMGFNQMKSCSIPRYSGKITFVFFKGQNTLTTASLQ